MARPLRLEFPGALYHVIARGNERKSIYRDDADRQRYLDRLAFYREKFSFQLLAYCLMDNHVHLAIETGKAPLSRIMAGLQSSYTHSTSTGGTPASGICSRVVTRLFWWTRIHTGWP
jgi:putative transposase